MASPSVVDVVNLARYDGEGKSISTPFVKQLVRNSVRRWKEKHEASINKRIKKVKASKKKERANNMPTLPEKRQIPLDVLAKEWMVENSVNLNVKVYLIEKLMPCLIMGLEKLLTEVEKRDLVNSERNVSFNPINYLAQYLMRNNPVYSNFPEASPYAKGLRKIAEDLKCNIFAMDAELAMEKMKADIQRKRMEREKEERLKEGEQNRRALLFQDLFIQWVQSEGVLPLSVVQSAIASFLDYVTYLHVDIMRSAHFAIEAPEIDRTGKLLNVTEFKQFLGEYSVDLSNQIFEIFMEHMKKCSYDFQNAAERVTIRFSLKSLFLQCDHDGVGYLDRNILLDLLGNFYDSSRDHVKETFRDPREWSAEDVEKFQEGKGDQEMSDEKPSEEQDEVKEGEKGEEVEGEQDNVEEDEVKVEEELSEEDEDHNSDDDDPRVGPNKVSSEDELSDRDSDTEQSRCSTRRIPVDHINQAQFINLVEHFMGEEPMRSALEGLIRFVKASYSETDGERVERQTKARKEAKVNKRKYMVEQLFDFWDVDKSGTLNFQEIYDVLSKWKDISADPRFQKFMEENEQKSELTCSELHEYIDAVSTQCFADEDPFEPIVIFLHTSIERTFEERRRGEKRKEWLNTIYFAAESSAGIHDVVYDATFKGLLNDAELHGKSKIISSSISLLENVVDDDQIQRHGKTMLHYVGATPDDVPYVVGKYLYRDMKNVSFASVDSGKPIHVSKVSNNPSVYLWNPERKEGGATGSMIVLPIKDGKKSVAGILEVDTLADPSHERSHFLSQEISFYQGVARVLGQAIEFVSIRSKTIQIADSAISWIRRRCQSVLNSCFYLVEPGLHPADGHVLRTMFTLDNKGKREHFSDPPKLNRRDNLFRDYLFQCIECSETITADAYGERHLAFPIIDFDGNPIALADISIGDLKALPVHEMKDIQKMLRFLSIAHREVAEGASSDKNIVLEAEKENEDFRIKVLFDRLLLMDLRENVSNLDYRAFAELKSYKDPPKLVHDIVKTVLVVFYPDQIENFSDWSTCKGYISSDLVKLLTQYDPTAPAASTVDWKKLSDTLEGIPSVTVAKQSSLPAQHLFNWAFVCLSLIEHTAKMNVRAKAVAGTAPSTSEESRTPFICALFIPSISP